MSVQLEALADEVFAAAAAQSRAGAQTIRRHFGEIMWSSTYPDLFFLNGIIDVVAPGWRATDLERAMQETIPDVRSFRAAIRDPKTIASLGASLTEAGYQHEIRVAMVQVTPHSDPPPQGGREMADSPRGGREIRILRAGEGILEELTRVDTDEHGWTPAMTEQLVALRLWAAHHTPTRFYIAFDGERAAGHVGLFQHGWTAYLHGLYTLPAHRRRGIGSALTLAMHGEMQAMGSERLTLQCTDDGYLPAFYHRLGFRRVGEQHIWNKQR